jgi:hypothetical protein
MSTDNPWRKIKEINPSLIQRSRISYDARSEGG